MEPVDLLSLAGESGIAVVVDCWVKLVFAADALDNSAVDVLVGLE